MKHFIVLFWRKVKFNVREYFRRRFDSGLMDIPCECCEERISFNKMHWTRYRPFRSWVASLCGECWKLLSPKDRLLFYRETFKKWEKIGMAQIWGPWEMIERKVLRGK
jgi:hypothetical protein